MLSAAVLLFGIMTIWLPPVRGALFRYPLATISVLILLALIFKFVQAGGTVGLMTGGVLALYVIGVIVGDTSRRPTSVAVLPPQTTAAILPALRPIDAPRPASEPFATPSPRHPAQQVASTPSASQLTTAPHSAQGRARF